MVKPFLRNPVRCCYEGRRRFGETVVSPMKKLHFDELSTGILTRSELCIDLFLEKVWLPWQDILAKGLYLFA